MSDRVEQAFANLRRGPWYGSPLGVPQEGPSGNGNIDSQGWLSDGSVTADVIQANAVIAGKIDADAVTAREIAAATITANEIAASTITGSNIAADTITGANIAANTITASEIAANTITANEIAANTITAAEIAADSITTSELAANAVITENILAANVTSSRMEVTISGKNFSANTGSAGAPGYYFDVGTNYGIFYLEAGAIDAVGIASNGSTVATFQSGRINALSSVYPTPDNTLGLGSSSNRWVDVWAVDGTINTSDARMKRDIADAPLGLDFVRSLPARVYRWRDTPDTQARESAAPGEIDANAKRSCVETIAAVRDRQMAGLLSDTEGDEIVAHAREWLDALRSEAARPLLEAQEKRRPGKRLHYGFIAQEVKAALDAAGVDPMDAAFWSEDENGQSLRYTELIAVLWRAVQELTDRVEALESR